MLENPGGVDQTIADQPGGITPTQPSPSMGEGSNESPCSIKVHGNEASLAPDEQPS